VPLWVVFRLHGRQNREWYGNVGAGGYCIKKTKGFSDTEKPFDRKSYSICQLRCHSFIDKKNSNSSVEAGVVDGGLSVFE